MEEAWWWGNAQKSEGKVWFRAIRNEWFPRGASDALSGTNPKLKIPPKTIDPKPKALQCSPNPRLWTPVHPGHPPCILKPSATQVSFAEGTGNCGFCVALLMAAAPSSQMLSWQGMRGRAAKLETRGQRTSCNFVRADACQPIRKLRPLAIKQLKERQHRCQEQTRYRHGGPMKPKRRGPRVRMIRKPKLGLSIGLV